MKIVKPNRVTRTYTQNLVGAPIAVFPLLCPVREADWIDGWSPPLVVTNSGVAEPDCVFTTTATSIDESPRDCRRLPELRGWEYDKAEAVFS
jgi:hypothetical protein